MAMNSVKDRFSNINIRVNKLETRLDNSKEMCREEAKKNKAFRQEISPSDDSQTTRAVNDRQVTDETRCCPCLDWICAIFKAISNFFKNLCSRS